MNTSIVPFGAEIAAPRHLSSNPDVYESPNLVTLQDLVDRLRDHPNAGMLRSASNKFAEYQGKPCSEVRIEALDSDCADFRDFLRERKYAKNSVRSYSNYVNMLATAARNPGWAPTEVQISPSWDPVAKAIKPGAAMILVRHLIKKGYEPSEVQECDLIEWTSIHVKKGRSYGHSRSSVGELRKYLIESGLDTQLSAKKVAKANYGMRLDQMSESLQCEIRDILSWKQDTFVAGRPAKAHVRAISASNLENAFRPPDWFRLECAGKAQYLIAERSGDRTGRDGLYQLGA